MYLFGRTIAASRSVQESIREYFGDVPEVTVSAICEKAMAREKVARYASSLDMADLQAYLDGRVVRAYRTGAVAEFKSWVSRNRGTAASVAAAVP